MALGSHVSYLQKGGAAKLPIKGDLVIFGVGVNILIIKPGRATNRLLLRPIHGSVRIPGRNIEGRGRRRESLAIVLTVDTVDERIGKLRGRGTTVIKAKGGIANLVVIGSTFEGGIELTPTDTDAAISWSTGQLAYQATVRTWGIGDSDARCEIVVADRRQCFRNARIAGKDPAGR